MSIYNDVIENNKNRSLQATKRLIKNQKMFNIIMMIFFGILLVSDLVVLIKGNFVGLPGFSYAFLLVSVILEGVIFLVLALLRFNSENMILKLSGIVIYSLPIVAFIPILGYGEIISILLFVFRIIIIGILVFELIKGRRLNDNRSFKFKHVIGFGLIGVILLLVILNLFIDNNRRIDYSYDYNLNGYVVDNVLEGSSDIKFKENTVKFNKDSLKNCNSRLDIPDGVVLVDKDAFKDSNVSEVHIISKNIEIMKALENSNVQYVYLDSGDINIVDINEVKNSNIRFIASKSDIDNYRTINGENDYLFVPKVDEDEFYVIFNGTDKKIEYYKKNEMLEYPSNFKADIEGNLRLLGFYIDDKLIEFPIKVDRNIELTAKWSRIYDLTFDYSGGSLLEYTFEFENKPFKIERIKEDGDLYLPKLSKNHYHFDGWFDNDKLVECINASNLDDMNLKAKFSKIYKLNYHENGGYIDDEEKNQEYIEGNIITPCKPTRLGYKFVGWYDNPSFDGDVIESVDKEGIDLYAKWEIISYNIIYHTDGINVNQKYKYTIEDNYVLLDSTRMGFEFKGWYSDSNYVNKVESISNSVGEIVLYAKFEAISYDIKYVTNGTNLNEISKYTIETDYELIDSNLNGYEFKGWYSDSNYINKITTLKGRYGNLVLYAKFDLINYSISYHTDGTNLNEVSIYNIETDYELIESCKDGFDFIGWYSDSEYNNKVINLLGNYGNLDLYARFDVTSYNITYHTDGLNPNSGKVSYTTLDDYELIDSSKDGYKFLGWYSNSECTSRMENLLGYYGDLDLYAKFELINYGINYHTDGTNLNEVIIYNIETNYELIDSSLDGYEFKGWYSDSLYNNRVDNLLGNFGELDLYAKFSPNKYIISYDANGGIIESDKKEVYYNSNYELLIPERTGYEFKGWYNGDELFENGVWTYLEGISLKASWDITAPEYVLSGDIDKVFDGVNEELSISVSHPLTSDNGIITVRWFIEGEDDAKFTGMTYSNIYNAENLNYYCDITISHKGKSKHFKTESINVNIKKADYDFSNVVFNDHTFNYEFNGQEQSPIIENIPVGLDGISLNVEYVKSDSFINVGSYGTVTAKFSTDSINYNVPEDMVCYVNILTKKLTISWNELSHVYDGNDFKPTGILNGVISGYPASISFNNIITKDAKKYNDISVTLIDSNQCYTLDENYNKVSYEILKANYDMSGITYDKKIFEYNGLYHIPTPSNLPSGVIFDSDNSIGLKDVINNGKVTLKFINYNSNYNDIDDILVEIVINPKKVNVILDNNSFTYNGNVLRPNCSITGVIEGDVLDYNITDQNSNAGIYNLSIELLNNNYIIDTENSDLEYEIKKASYNMTGIIYDNEFIYNGLYQLPNVSNLPIGVEFDSDNSIGLKDVTNNGKITLKFINKNSNYNDVDDIIIDVIIKKKNVTISLVSDEFTYSGDVITPELVIDGVILGDSVIANVTNSSKNVGLYTANILLSNDNYDIDLLNSNLEYEIIKADFIIEYEISGLSYTYDGLYHKPIVSKSSHYTEDGTLITYEILNEYKDYGNYSVGILYSAGDNYNSKTIYYDLVINKREITLSFETLNHEFDGYAFLPSITKFNNIIDGDNLSADISVKDKDGKDIVEVGNYILVITLTGNSSNNYELSEEYEVSIVTKIDEIDLSTINIIHYNGQYDGLYHTVGVTNLPDGVTAIFDASYKDVCKNSIVNISFKSNDPNIGYSNKAIGYVTITQREVTILFDQNEFVYNGSVQKPNGTIVGKVSGDDVNVLISTDSINVGHYEATVSLDNSNYKMSSSAELSYDITECHVTLVWDNLDLIYEKKALKPTAHVKYNDKVLDTRVDVTTETTNINVGIYQATASLIDTNYIIDGSSTTNYNIIQKEVALNWYNYDLYYDGEEKMPLATVNVLDGDNCKANVSVEGDHIIPGTYKAIATLDNDNYKILGNDYYNYNISKGIFDSSSFASKVSQSTTKVYNGELQNPTILGDKIYASDGQEIIVEAAGSGYRNSGNYSVDIVFKTSNNYYEEYIISVNLRITQLELDIEFDNDEFEYDNTVKVPEVIINNKIPGDELNVVVDNKSVSIENNIKAIFKFSGMDKDNYKITENYYYSIIKGSIDMSGVLYDNAVTYNGSYQLPNISNLPLGVEVDKVNSIGVKNVSDNLATIVFKISDELAANYKLPEPKEIDMVVNKKSLVVNITNDVFGYDGMKHLPTYTLDGIIGDDIVDLIFTDDGNINRGNYQAKASDVNNINYQLDEMLIVDYSITLGEYDMSLLSFNDKIYTYDGEVHKNISITGNLPEGADGITLGVSYEYENISGAYKNVGSYKIIAKFNTTSVNYNIPSDMECYVTINKKELQVSWSEISHVYDGLAHRPNVLSVSGIISGDSVDYEVVGSGTNAGNYVATININNDNYVVTDDTKTIDFVISKATYDMSGVVFENATYTYDGISHRQEVSGLTNVIGIDNSSPQIVEYVGDKIRNVSDGIVNITVYFKTDSLNYETPNPITRTLEITPKLLDVEVIFDGSITSNKNEFSVSYDGLVHSFIVNYDSSDLIGNDELTISIPDTKLAGTYNYNMEFSNDNYSANNTLVKLTINPYSSYDKIDWDYESGKLYPDAYWTINGNRILLTTLGDGVNNVYYKFYSSNGKTVLDEIPYESGIYYVEIISDYSGLVINSWNSKLQYKLSYDSFKSSYDGTYSSGQVTYSGNSDNKHQFTYDGETYTSGLKLETGGGEVTITVSSNMTAYIFIGDVEKKVKVNGKSSAVSDSNGIITVDLTSGTNTITKDNPVSVYLVFGEYIKLGEPWS